MQYIVQVALVTVLLIGWIADAVRAQERSFVVSGIVYHDKNGNQQMDRGEKPINGIEVSNGRDLIRTNRKGEFELQAVLGQSIFPILPSDYTLGSGDSGALNAHFFYIDPQREYTDTITIAFPFTKRPSPNNFRFGAVGDIQIGNEAERAYAAKSIFTELRQRDDLAFQVVLGDLVNDELSLFDSFHAMLSDLQHASWTLAGNHDRDVSVPAHMDHVFNRHFGATNYAFYYGEVLFVVFNNVHSTGKHGYEGRYSMDQLTFLDGLVGSLPTEQLIVINQHIPLASTRNGDELIDRLSRFDRVLVLSGHTHRVSRHFHGNGNIHEVVVGAPSGTWWRGEKDLDGIPLALQHCGAPRNYFLVDVADSQYRIEFKAIGLDAHKQSGITVADGQLIVNLYGASDRTQVRVRLNNGTEQGMEKVRIPDPDVTAIVRKNKDKIYPTPGNNVLPLREQASAHIWSVALDSLGLENLRQVELLAEDDYGYRVHQYYYF